jgi:hypothetical protein
MCADEPDNTLHGAFAPPTHEFEAAPTTQFAAPIGRATSQLALIFVAVAAASFLAGIGVASVSRPIPNDPTLAAQDVGPSGGTLRFEGGEIRIPEGALAEVVTVVVHRTVVDRRVTVDAGGGSPLVFEPGRLVAYRLEPSDVTFAKSVEIVFRLPAGASNGTIFTRRSDDRIVLLKGKIDANRGTATTKVGDFRFGGAA